MHASPVIASSIPNITQAAPTTPPIVKQQSAPATASSPSSVVNLSKAAASRPQLVYSADTLKAQQASNAAKAQVVSPLLSSKPSETATH